MGTVTLRPFKNGDEFAVSDVICTTLAISNQKDYEPAFIENNIKSHRPTAIAQWVKDVHFYVAMDGEMIIGCGGITSYWGSTEKSYLTTIFVLPEYQGKGVGRKIVETLEADEYFCRAWRTEVGSSLTAVHFYEKMGYRYLKEGNASGQEGIVRMEKRK